MKEGHIIKALSGFYYVMSEEQVYACKGRGVFRNQNISPLVGDYVTFDQTNEDEGYITTIKARKNELNRPPVANITQALLVNSITEPTFSPLLLDRFLVIMEAKNIKPMIVLTKTDLASKEQLEKIVSYKEDYERIGYPVTFFSSHNEATLKQITNYLADEITVVMGQSGVGKSTLLNSLDPSLTIETAEISKSLGRGKHTTRHVELHRVHGGLVADTPGFSSIDFSDIEADELSAHFVEIAKVSEQCRFRSCLHEKEPHCAVKDAVAKNEISPYRYDNYISFLHEILSRKPRYKK